MPLLIDPIQKRQVKKRPKRVLKPLNKLPKVETQLRKNIERLWAEVLLPISKQIEDLAKQSPPPTEFMLELIEKGLQEARLNYGILSNDVVRDWRISLGLQHQSLFDKALARSLGVDVTTKLEKPEIAEALQKAATANVENLVKSIPEEYFKKTIEAVLDNFYGRPLPEGRSLLKQIQEVGKVTRNRAKLIARDQTSKLTGQLNEVSQREIGVEEYIWRTSKDNRVVGNPRGISPPTPKMETSKTHGNHYEREGKRFRWDSPPPDGHPGQPIQCRCWAEPVIDFKKFLTEY